MVTWYCDHVTPSASIRSKSADFSEFTRCLADSTAAQESWIASESIPRWRSDASYSLWCIQTAFSGPNRWFVCWHRPKYWWQNLEEALKQMIVPVLLGNLAPVSIFSNFCSSWYHFIHIHGQMSQWPHVNNLWCPAIWEIYFSACFFIFHRCNSCCSST